jgi:hypothetical protein
MIIAGRVEALPEGVSGFQVHGQSLYCILLTALPDADFKMVVKVFYVCYR